MSYTNVIPRTPAPISMLPDAETLDSTDLLLLTQPSKARKSKKITLNGFFTSQVFKNAAAAANSSWIYPSEVTASSASLTIAIDSAIDVNVVQRVKLTSTQVTALYFTFTKTDFTGVIDLILNWNDYPSSYGSLSFGRQMPTISRDSYVRFYVYGGSIRQYYEIGKKPGNVDTLNANYVYVGSNGKSSVAFNFNKSENGIDSYVHMGSFTSSGVAPSGEGIYANFSEYVSGTSKSSELVLGYVKNNATFGTGSVVVSDYLYANKGLVVKGNSVFSDGSLRVDSFWCKGAAIVGGSLTLSGALSVSNTLNVTGLATMANISATYGSFSSGAETSSLYAKYANIPSLKTTKLSVESIHVATQNATKESPYSFCDNNDTSGSDPVGTIYVVSIDYDPLLSTATNAYLTGFGNTILKRKLEYGYSMILVKTRSRSSSAPSGSYYEVSPSTLVTDA